MAQDGKMIRLRSSDGRPFEISVKAAKLSRFLAPKIEDQPGGGGGVIEVPNVAFDALNMAIMYCEKHAGVAPAAASSSSRNPVPAANTGEQLEKWDKDLVGGLNLDGLHDLMLAAHYLQITDLLNLTCKKIAGVIKGKDPEQIRQIFNIANDFTMEDANANVNEYGWAFGH